MDRLRRFYADEYEEDVRLTRSPHGRLEFARTVELLERVLPAPPARVLDVGGGTGVHARWSAAAGFDVVLVDLMAEHVSQRRESTVCKRWSAMPERRRWEARPSRSCSCSGRCTTSRVTPQPAGATLTSVVSALTRPQRRRRIACVDRKAVPAMAWKLK